MAVKYIICNWASKQYNKWEVGLIILQYSPPIDEALLNDYCFCPHPNMVFKYEIYNLWIFLN